MPTAAERPSLLIYISRCMCVTTAAGCVVQWPRVNTAQFWVANASGSPSVTNAHLSCDAFHSSGATTVIGVTIPRNPLILFSILSFVHGPHIHLHVPYKRQFDFSHGQSVLRERSSPHVVTPSSSREFCTSLCSLVY